MTERLELSDIQGNIVRAYGRFGFPHARYFFLHVSDADAGRALLRDLGPRVTTAERWAGGPDNRRQEGIARPLVTLNVALSYAGLRALGIPGETLRSLPDAFTQGMVHRARLLGDEGANALKNWDPIWRRAAADPADAVHVMISMSAQMQPDGTPVAQLDARTDWLRGLVRDSGGGVRLLDGIGPDGADFQQAGARLARDPDGSVRSDPREHFGFVDGIGDPVFDGQFTPEAQARRVKGRGKQTRDGKWKPLATGEFVIGHVDESQEMTAASRPDTFTRNGSFMAFRKLHEDVATFNSWLEEAARGFAAARGISRDEAVETLKAKMIGRWANGVPLMAAPTWADLQAFEKEWFDIPALRGRDDRSEAEDARLQAYKEIMVDFRYRDDKIGLKCPIASHIRRGNVRDYLDPQIYAKSTRDFGGTAISNRRRILRRGLPYGSFDPDMSDPNAEHGVIFIAVCGSLERQFEFVLQQWINYGMDNNSGNDTCPLLGTRPEGSKFVIQSDRESGEAPWILADLPQFVTTRGGEYFFIPGLTALRMIASGTVEPV